MRRKIREAKKTLHEHSDDQKGKEAVRELTEQLNQTELEHYQQCEQNYPTDLQVKYQYAVRLVRNERFDEAIPLLQEAQRDPRHKILAKSKIGLCFYEKGWYQDAIDIYLQAIEAYEIKDDAIAKELRYNLGRAYEDLGRADEALEIFRKIAQLDFGYKDVRSRIGALRQKGTDSTSQ